MKKVLVVDDQQEVHDEIEEMLMHFAYAPVSIKHAYDFKSAKEYLKTDFPDIVLLDIVMPHKDGFALAEYINSQGQSTAIIIMTAYPQLDYALKAIKSKVFAFLVKPFSVLELHAVLTDILAEDTTNKQNERNQSQHRHLYLRMLEEYLTGKRNDLDFQKICDQTGLDAIINNGYLTLLLDVKRKEESNESICATAQWLQDKGHKNICFICEDHRIVYMIAMTNKPTINEIHDLEEHLQTNYFSYKAGAAYGDRAHGIRNTYKNADFALKYIEFMKLDSRVVCYHQLNPGTCLTQQHFGSLYEAYQRKHLNTFKQTLDELFADFMSNMIAPDAAAAALVETWSVHKVDLSFLRSLTSLNAMHASLLSFFIPFIQDNTTKGLPESVVTIIRYIEDHYSEPIDLNTTASNLNMSYAYTSTLFKKSMGLSFSQYVNRYRMQKAVELLDHTNCFVYEVAEKVGFESNKYFFKKFKEKYNMTPNEYQRRSINRGLELDA